MWIFFELNIAVWKESYIAVAAISYYGKGLQFKSVRKWLHIK